MNTRNYAMAVASLASAVAIVAGTGAGPAMAGPPVHIPALYAHAAQRVRPD